MYTRLNQCRICGNTNLVPVLDLGEQMLTGVFPRKRNAEITSGPLRLVKCMGGDDVCGLLQLEHTYDNLEMYGENYGYRSGLNASMVAHLHGKVKKICENISIEAGDLIIDIGSNDSTTLQAYTTPALDLVGIDPTGLKFRSYYPEHIQLIPEFFSADLVRDNFPGRKAKVVTSFSMFYDLENPMEFMREVHDILQDEGIWVFEQSYMPTMLQQNSYDTVCHEHLEYYALRQVKWMTDRVGFKIIDVEFNDINGGSFSVTAVKTAREGLETEQVEAILDSEAAAGLDGLHPYEQFEQRVESTRDQLRGFLEEARAAGKSVAGLGASTKGNVILQYCGITEDDIACIGEVNSEKFDCFTPGTWLPIVPEDRVLAQRPDYLIILPWHFKQFFLDNKKFAEHTLVTPLPEVSIISGS